MTPQFDIVIVNYNTREELATCLASLAASPPSRLGRILVVDNASPDGSVDIVRERWPHVHVSALERNVGFAAANNIAIRMSDAPLILLLNSDTVVPAGALDTLANRLISTGATAAGPRLVDAAGRPEISFGPMLSPLGELTQRLRVHLAGSRTRLAERYVASLVSKERTVDWVSGACLLVGRAAAIDAGLLDERYFMYEEDVDFCAALRARGGRILFTPRSEVVHLRGRSTRQTPSEGVAHYDRSHVAFYDQHAPRWAPWLRLWLRARGRRIR